MNEKIISLRIIIATGIGIILMFLLMRFAAVPSGVINTYFNPGIVILTVFAAIFGPIAGLLIGLISHILVDLTRDNISISWIAADALYGLSIGIFWKFYFTNEGKFGVKQAIFFNGIQIIANVFAWIAVAPTLDVFIKQESANVAYLQGLVAGLLNAAAVLILGTIILFYYARIITRNSRKD
jgi:energy-coupling factor transport system substrate-specific component